MWVTKAGAVQQIEDGTYPDWRAQGWVEWEPDESGGSGASRTVAASAADVASLTHGHRFDRKAA